MTRAPVVLRIPDEVRATVREAHGRGLRVGLVPTMGALHEGHLSLIRAARADTDFVVVTLFVNPTQFGPAEDLAAYPRPFDHDLRLCGAEGVDVVFAPDIETMYPADFQTAVRVAGLSERVEGACRPGHFQGVATVVLKLFHIVGADVAYFGQKDAQQAGVIRQMVRDLNVPIQIRVCPIVRDADGLALSSRNRYLDAAERQQALLLSRSLRAACDAVAAGDRDPDSVRHKMRSVLESGHGVRVDYAELVDATTFEPVTEIAGSMLAVVAARVGKARLIDNMAITTDEGPSHQ